MSESKNKESKNILKLTPKQFKFATLLASPEGKQMTVEEICTALKISKDTYYKNLRNPDIIAETRRQVKEYAEAFHSRAWHNLMEACDEHNVPAIKLYFEMMGEHEDNGGVITVRITD